MSLFNTSEQARSQKNFSGGGGSSAPNRDDPKYATCHNIKQRHKGTVSKPVKFARTTVFGGGRAQTFGEGARATPVPLPPLATGLLPSAVRSTCIPKEHGDADVRHIARDRLPRFGDDEDFAFGQRNFDGVLQLRHAQTSTVVTGCRSSSVCPDPHPEVGDI